MATPSRTSFQDKPVTVPLSEGKSMTFCKKLEEYLSSSDGDCDVVFAVGPEGEKVKAVRLLLVVSSPVFKHLFENSWDSHYHTYSDEGIPLHDIDPEAFRLFLKLIICEDLSVDKIEELQLSPKNLFNLLDISKKYGMPDMQASLECLVEQFFKTIHKFVKTKEFLSLPINILSAILQRNSLPMDEVAVFDCARNWAAFQCIAQGYDQSGPNIRDILGNHIYAIRFPVMSIKDFGNRICTANILTPLEELQIFKYISMDDSEKQSFDYGSIPFNVERRKRCEPAPSKTTNAPTSAAFKETKMIKGKGSQGQLINSLATSQFANRTPKLISKSETAIEGQDQVQQRPTSRVGRPRLEVGVDKIDQPHQEGRALASTSISAYLAESESALSTGSDDFDENQVKLRTPSSCSTSARITRSSTTKKPVKTLKPATPSETFKLKLKARGATATGNAGRGKPKKSAPASASKRSATGLILKTSAPAPSPSQQRLARNRPQNFPRKKCDELPLSASLADGAFINVCRKWNCGKLTICADEDGPMYEVLEKLLEDHGKTAPPMDRVPEISEVVIAPDSRGRYFRGIVTGIRKDDEVKVEFVDYGGEFVVKQSQLKELSEEINEHPIYGLKFCLQDVPENAFNLNVTKNAELKKAMETGGTIEVFKKGSAMWTGKLWITKNRSWGDIILDAMKSKPGTAKLTTASARTPQRC